MGGINEVLKPTPEEEKESKDRLDTLTQEAKSVAEKADEYIQHHGLENREWDKSYNQLSMSILYCIRSLYKQNEIIIELLKRRCE